MVSANVNLPITAGYPVPASFAPLWATTASMLAVVLFCVLLKVVVLLPVAALTVHRTLDAVSVQVKSRVLRTVDGIIAGHIGQQR